MTTSRTPALIAAEIAAWDMQDISVLRDLISEIRDYRDENGERVDTERFIDMTSLPSAEIPADIDTTYPVWAIDAQGRALVGAGADSIETLDEIRADF